MTKTQENNSNDIWQTRLLPFMVGFITFLVVVYFLIFVFELKQVNADHEQFKVQSIDQQVQALTKNSPDISDKLYHAELLSMLYRHRSADSIIESRILTINLSFLTGVILAFLGAIFILGKFNENISKLEGEANKMKVSIASSSPGIILSCLGVILISVCIFSKSTLEVKDQPVYLNGEFKIPENQPKTLKNSLKIDSAIQNLKKITQ